MKLDAYLRERLAVLKLLQPAELQRLGRMRLGDLVVQEAARSRARVAELEARYPSAPARELAQRLVDAKKGLAGMVGGVSGVFGLLALPADLLLMAWLQMTLLVDVATLYKVNLRSARARGELLDLFGYATGLGPLQRAGPRLLGSVAGKALQRGGLSTLGRALPLVAAPVTAYLNNQHIQEVGDQAVRFYEGFHKAHVKSRQRASGS
jgi:uncharacterized protein (DUF697 family)